jgi:hypothetical protein
MLSFFRNFPPGTGLGHRFGGTGSRYDLGGKWLALGKRAMVPSTLLLYNAAVKMEVSIA